MVRGETVPDSLSLILPRILQENLDPVLASVQVMIEMTDQKPEKTEIIKETMERLESSVLQELPEKIKLLLMDHLQKEHNMQCKARQGYNKFFQKELAEDRVNKLVNSAKKMVINFKEDLAILLEESIS